MLFPCIGRLVRRPLILTLQTLLVLAITIGVNTETRPTCEPKSVLLDANGEYTVPYEVCVSSDPASKCQPTNNDCDSRDCAGVPPGVGSIASVQFINDTCKGTIHHSQNAENFSVSDFASHYKWRSSFNCIDNISYRSPYSGKLLLTVVFITVASRTSMFLSAMILLDSSAHVTGKSI